MSSDQVSASHGERYSVRGIKALSDCFANRTAASHARFFTPYLRSGLRLLDCGCGPGTISIGLAEAIAPGQLVGIDLDEQHVQLAQHHAADSGVANVHFETASVYQIPYDDQSFDAVFCHAVLEHLDQPDKALTEIYRVLKPQGLLGIRTPDHDGCLLWPDTPSVRAAMEFITKVIASHGGDGSRGKQLRERLNNAGFVDIRSSASYESYGTPEAVQAWLKRVRQLPRTQALLNAWQAVVLPTPRRWRSTGRLGRNGRSIQVRFMLAPGARRLAGLVRKLLRLKKVAVQVNVELLFLGLLCQGKCRVSRPTLPAHRLAN